MVDSIDEYVIGSEVDRIEVTTGIFSVTNHKLQLVHEYKMATKDITDFSKYVAALLVDLKNEHGIVIKRACFGAPGNTNAQKNLIYDPHFLSFAIDGKAIQTSTAIDQALVVNDFECVGFGTQAIDQTDIITLHQGLPRGNGMRAVVGAGNGLGTGLMIWDTAASCYMPSPLSYSFVDFCSQSELELKFARYLQITTGSQSWGKVLGASGGILRLYDFLDKHRQYQSPYVQHKHYLDVFAHRYDERCKDAVALYMKLYARLVRNVVYAQLPYNGVYITSTIAEHYPELFTDASFMEEFFNTNNEYLRNYITNIPVYLVAQPKMRLYGAALYALAYDKKSFEMKDKIQAQK